MYGTFGKSLHISLELSIACFLRRNWLFVLAKQTLEIFVDGLSLRLCPLRQEFRSLVIYLKVQRSSQRLQSRAFAHHRGSGAAWQRSIRFRFIPPVALPPDVQKASGLPARLFYSVGATPQIRGIAPRE